jgi:hypothetical protein
VSWVVPTWNVEVKVIDAQLLPCGMGNVMVVKLPTPVTDEVKVTEVVPDELIIGALPFHIWTTTEPYDWWSASTGLGPV